MLPGLLWYRDPLGGKRNTASIYQSIPPVMRQAARPVALNRMTMQDPQAADKWFERNQKFNPMQDGNAR